jgi:hypothetical protein
VGSNLKAAPRRSMPESIYKMRESSYPLQEIRAVRRYAITKARHAATSGRAFQNENVEKLREMAEKRDS